MVWGGKDTLFDIWVGFSVQESSTLVSYLRLNHAIHVKGCFGLLGNVDINKQLVFRTLIKLIFNYLWKLVSTRTTAIT